MPKRYDAHSFRKAELTKDGFLKVDAILTRTGVFPYRLDDGTIRRELRLPEEVFKADAMKSFEMLPVTDLHPPVPVSADNANKFAAGSIGDQVRRDGEYMVAPMMVTNRKLVQDMREKRKVEVSCGYDCDLDHTSGEWNGQRYDAIQRNIRGNHVAIVPRGRAGPEVRVRLDAGDGVPLDSSDGAVQPGNERTEPTRMDKIEIDGILYSPDQVPAVLARRDAAQAEARKTAAAELATFKAELEKSKARADALQADLDKATKARTDAEDPKRVRELVSKRVAIETKARALLGAEVKLDAMDEKAIGLAMLEKLEPGLKLDGKTDEYVQCRIDYALERHEKESSGLANLRRATAPHRTDAEEPRRGQRKDTATAKNDFYAATEDAWKVPLGYRPEGMQKKS